MADLINESTRNRQSVPAGSRSNDPGWHAVLSTGCWIANGPPTRRGAMADPLSEPSYSYRYHRAGIRVPVDAFLRSTGSCDLPAPAIASSTRTHVAIDFMLDGAHWATIVVACARSVSDTLGNIMWLLGSHFRVAPQEANFLLKFLAQDEATLAVARRMRQGGPEAFAASWRREVLVADPPPRVWKRKAGRP